MQQTLGFVILSLCGCADGLVPTPIYQSLLWKFSSETALLSYLDTLSTNVIVSPSPDLTDVTDVSQSTFYHAPRSFFSPPNLRWKGPRSTADVGTPEEASRQLIEIGESSVGSWTCTAGGWPSLNPKAHTEIFYVWSGHGSLTDRDGEIHYFGPGDTVIIPKGHTGRWDVLADMHKVWFVHEHDQVEESEPIRVRVIHYQDLVSKQNQVSYGVSKDVVRGNPEIYSNVVYNAGPINVGSWMCTPGCFNIESLDTTIEFHVLEGQFYITHKESGQCSKCMPGDTVALPRGWSGSVDVVETAKKLWTNFYL
ncbi:hypothetical protein ACHAWX_003446 [Stephanocyclus meneghinianus]